MASKDRYLIKIKDTWYFRKSINGKLVKRSLETSDRSIARDFRDIYLNNLLIYQQLDPPVESNEKISFGMLAKTWAAIHKTEVKYSTWRDYVSSMNRHILPFFKDRPIDEISYIEILEFRKNLNLSAKRINNILVPMKSVFDMADRDGLIRENVMKKIKRLRQETPDIRPLSYEQIQELLIAVDPWYKPYVQVLFFTGARAGELSALQWSDYQEKMGNGPHLFIRKTFVYGRDGEPKTPKSKRSITCLPEVINALREQKRLTGNRDHIFLTKDGNRMTPDHFRHVVWVPALKRAGLEYIPPIQTRHTFATIMLSAGEDIGWVQNMLGHSSLQMIFQRYYAWISNKTRSDGKAFREFIGQQGSENEKMLEASSDEINGSGALCTKIVPIEAYRIRKRKAG